MAEYNDESIENNVGNGENATDKNLIRFPPIIFTDCVLKSQ